MKRFDIGGALLAATPTVFLLYNVTDNPSYYNLDGTEPNFDQWLLELNVSADAQCKVEVGLCKSDRTGFVPYYAGWLSATSGPIEKNFRSQGPKLTMSDAAVNQLAIRLTSTAGGTVHASGDVATAKV